MELCLYVRYSDVSVMQGSIDVKGRCEVQKMGLRPKTVYEIDPWCYIQITPFISKNI